MRKYLLLLLSLLLILAFIPGCGGKADAEKNLADAEKELEEVAEDLEDALSVLASPGWPTGKIPDLIPEYPYGEVTNSGDFGDGEYVILISPTNEDELKEYHSLLESAGFAIIDGERGARQGTVALRFQFNTTDTLQIIVSDQGSSSWPSFPGDLLPPDKGTLYGEVHIPTLSDDDKASGNYYTASFSLVDLTEEDCYAYIQKLVDNGWSGGYDMVSKEVSIDGVLCNLTFQFVQYYDGQGDFNLAAWAM